ncbi:MAG: hypothetical protein ACK5XN_25705 [Bacteroidota bacterium]
MVGNVLFAWCVAIDFSATEFQVMNFKQILMDMIRNNETTNKDHSFGHRDRGIEQTSLDMTTSPKTIITRHRGSIMLLEWKLWQDGSQPAYRCFYKSLIAIVKESKRYRNRWQMSIHNDELGTVKTQDDIFSLAGACQSCSNVIWGVYHAHAPWEMYSDE